MPVRDPLLRRHRLQAGVHLRLARLADLAGVAAFCERHRAAGTGHDQTPAGMSALLRGHVDTVIVALQERTLLGVALCGITQGRARLLALVVNPGRARASIERRLLRRSLRNLRTLGLGALDFSTIHEAPTRGREKRPA